ncbi:MAG: PqiC family protein [Gammaproteobacteria bacterium]|nr:PqiC family protein [Gammaproteobacteria bacterium]
MTVTARSMTLGILVSLLLVACGSSPPVRYFSLSPMDSALGQDPDDAITLALGPLRMPDYLNRSQIVTRAGGAEIQVDEFSRWAEPLRLAMHRVVSTDVDGLLDGVVVIAFPYDSIIRSQVDYRLLGDVIRFDADQSGRVVLEVQWIITDTDSAVAVPIHRRRYEARAATADDPAAVAVAMNDALASFSRDIANEMGAVLQD